MTGVLGLERSSLSASVRHVSWIETVGARIHECRQVRLLRGLEGSGDSVIRDGTMSTPNHRIVPSCFDGLAVARNRLAPGHAIAGAGAAVTAGHPEN